MRISVVDVLELLAAGHSPTQVLKELPDLQSEDIKACLMRPTPDGAEVVFSEAGMQMFTPTAATWGRVRIQHPDRVVDLRYVRVYSKRETRWQAVFVVVFPVGTEA